MLTLPSSKTNVVEAFQATMVDEPSLQRTWGEVVNRLGKFLPESITSSEQIIPFVVAYCHDGLRMNRDLKMLHAHHQVLKDFVQFLGSDWPGVALPPVPVGERPLSPMTPAEERSFWPEILDAHPLAYQALRLLRLTGIQVNELYYLYPSPEEGVAYIERPGILPRTVVVGREAWGILQGNTWRVILDTSELHYRHKLKDIFRKYSPNPDLTLQSLQDTFVTEALANGLSMALVRHNIGGGLDPDRLTSYFLKRA